jgi:hypothetical protein
MTTDASASHEHPVTRRQLLRGAAVAGATTALTLAPVSFAQAGEQRGEGDRTNEDQPNKGQPDQTRVVTGRIEEGPPDFVYLPIDVPGGVREIAVSYSYNRPPVPPGVPGNACDIGIFDERGIEIGGRGFRGWSGGFRTEFAISATQATPGYLPGPVKPGRWNVVLGPYQVAPAGLDYRVEITLRYGAAGPAFVPAFPPQQVPGTGPGWYRGDCHLHTVHSDGARLPEEVAAGARAAGLNFIVSTEHNTSSAHAVWGPLAGNDLLILLGEEITTRNGHCLTLGVEPGLWVDWRYRARDEEFPKVVKQVRGSGGLVVPAHPYCPFIGCQWKFGYADADAIEVWNGPWTIDDQSSVDTWDAQLALSIRRGGGWLPAIGNSDAHREPQVIGLPHTVVGAQRLDRAAVMDGIRAGRSWLAESAGVELSLIVTGGGASAGIGDTLTVAESTPVDVSLTVSGVPSGVVRLLTDEGQMHQESLPASGTGTARWRTTAAAAAYVRAEVRHPRPDGTAGPGGNGVSELPFGPMAAMTNPVLLRAGRR